MNTILSYIPFFFFLGAPTTSGIMLMTVSVQPIVGLLKAKLEQHQGPTTYQDIFASYPVVWQFMIELTFARMLLLGLIGLVVGMVFAEVFYRLAILLRYHKEFFLEPPNGGDPNEADVTEFDVQCRLMKDGTLHRAFEWEKVQFTFQYYMEGNLWVFVVGVLISGLIVQLSGGAPIDVCRVALRRRRESQSKF